MPHIIEITDLSAPELDVFARLTEAQLRSRRAPERALFIAESPKVIGHALDAGYEPVSLLMERRQLEGPARDILARCGDVPLYTAGRDTLAALTGYELTRGVLCAMRRPSLPAVEELCAGARRVAVLEGRKQYCWYLKGIAHSGYYKEQIVRMNTLEDARAVTRGIQRDLTD